MFVPRALRLKGVREPQRPKPTALSKPAQTEKSRDDALVDAMQGISTNSPTPLEEDIDRTAFIRGPKFTVKPVTPEYLDQLIAGIELIFSDYAHHEDTRAEWLQQKYRNVDGEEKFIHLTALLEHPTISSLKPEPTQVLLQQAIRERHSPLLDLASNGYHVRRRPSTYPPKFLPRGSLEQVDDDGLSFWDQRTIYVEPHLRNICQTPAKVAHWLKEHGQMRSKWLPVQAVHTLYNSCAFVVLSGNVMHEDVWSNWRSTNKPDDWRIMTKVEHTKRTAEYVALLAARNPNKMRKSKPEDANIPAIARPAVLPMNVDIGVGHAETTDRPKNKRKRNRRKADKDQSLVKDAEADTTNEAPCSEPRTKRRG
ncbi:hypothetical protein DE146DRAFT_507569 [Phaeosphaeria sp. MPI-PUGE-AT-0046c]|nr:hypothetical protein DE146DRAFT_507569 [Phaeosphaeria sp. MPI-PUGE-AT-0046c]